MKSTKLLALSVISFFSLNSFSAGFLWLKKLEQKINLFGYEIYLKEHVFQFVLAALCFVVLGFLYRKSISKFNDDSVIIPDKKISLRNLIEEVGQGIYGLCEQVMDEKRAKDYFIFSCFIFLFIFITNVFGLIPGFNSATANMNTAFALGLFSFCYFNIKGIKAQGFKGYMAHFLGPILLLAPLIFFLEFLSMLVRPLSLALRLQGNISGDHKVLGAIMNMADYPVAFPIPIILFGLFVCFMQAFVFTILSIVYIALATEHHDHDHDHGHEGELAH